MAKIGILTPEEAGAKAKRAVAEWEARKRRDDTEARRAKPAPEAPKAAERPVVPAQQAGEPAEEEAAAQELIIAVRSCDLEFVRKVLGEKEIMPGAIEKAIEVAAELGKAFRDEASGNVDWLRSSSSPTPMNEIERCTRMAGECDKIAEELEKYGATK